jgi:hypothetical protein
MLTGGLLDADLCQHSRSWSAAFVRTPPELPPMTVAVSEGHTVLSGQPCEKEYGMTAMCMLA